MAFRRYWKRKHKGETKMQILELQIKNFGKFTNKIVRFHEGVNILYGENEMGKSTIHSFIKGMFFGIEKQRGRAAKNDEYSQRQPWDNPNYFAGALRFESGGKVFRLERNFEKREKSVYFLCETDGEELSVEDGDLEIFMEGLNEAAFRNTVFIPQKSGETDEGLASEVKRFMSNLESAGDSDIDINAAQKYLADKRKELENSKKEKQEKSATALREVQIKLEYNNREMADMRSELEGQTRQLAATKKEKERLEDVLLRQFSPEKREHRLGFSKGFLTLGSGIIAVGIGIFAPFLWLKFVVILVWLAVAGLSLWNFKKESDHSSRIESEENGKKEELKQRLRKVDDQYKKCQWNLEHLKTEWKEKNITQGNLQELMAEIETEGQNTDEIDGEIQAILLASKQIQTVSEEVYKRTEKVLNDRVSQILSEVTQGRYTNVFIDSELQVRIHTPEKLLTIHQISRGTMEQVYFALRMAVGEMLCKKEPMPVILDDAFVMYDEDRLAQTLKWLHESKRQVILFTCHRREQELLEKSLEIT